MVSGLSIKRSLGLLRGKSDPIDARAIADYGYLWQNKLVPYTMPTKAIRELKDLLKLRDRMVKQRAGYKSTVREQKKILNLGDDQLLVKRHKDGYWKMQAQHPGQVHFQMEQAGKASRWNTLRALRVLRHFNAL